MRTSLLSLAFLLLALMVAGCSENSSLVGAEADDRLTLADQDAIRSVEGHITATYAEDTGRMLRPSRLVNAEISFRVVVQDQAAETARGEFELRDNLGNRYLATIQYLEFSGDNSVKFWGPLTSVTDRETDASWVFVSVQDEGRENDHLTFQFGPPAPHPDVALPDREGTEVEIVRGDIIIDSGTIRAKRLF